MDIMGNAPKLNNLDRTPVQCQQYPGSALVGKPYFLTVGAFFLLFAGAVLGFLHFIFLTDGLLGLQLFLFCVLLGVVRHGGHIY